MFKDNMFKDNMFKDTSRWDGSSVTELSVPAVYYREQFPLTC